MSTDEDNDSIFDDISPTPGSDHAAGGAELFDEVGEVGTRKPSSGRGTVKIGKQTYAVGLIWQTTSSGDDAEAEAKLAAKDDLYRANSYCIRESAIIQYGLGQKTMGHRPGMRALAAMIADKMTGNWLAAFEVENDIYLVAVRDGQILSDYDRLLTQLREARDLFNELLYSAEWDAVLAPVGWAVDEADPSDLNTYIDSGRDFRLKSVGSNAKQLVLVVGVVALAAGGYMFMQPSDDYGDWQPPTDYGMPPDEMGGPGDGLGEGPLDGENADPIPVEQPPTPPWVNRPNGIGALIACTDDIKIAPIEAPGWDTDEVSCSGTDITLSLSRTRGNVLWAQEYFQGLGHRADFGNRAGANALGHTYPASFVSPYTADVATQSIDKVQRYLGLHFEELGQDITFDPTPNYSDGIVDRYYERGGFTFETDLDPTEFIDVLSPIPALLIEEVHYSLEQSVWSISGRYYFERPDPIPPPAPEPTPAQN